jgi:Fanconi-associated nuclease 1
VKRDEIKDSECEDSEQSGNEDESRAETSLQTHTIEERGVSVPNGVTAFENVLPPTQTDEGTIERYEQMKSSRIGTENDDGTSEKTKPLWIKGRSSIYVDAFNLALDTVLEEESQLFDEKEKAVFGRWKDLPYEAQYL